MVTFSTANVVSNTTEDVAIEFMQRYVSNNGVPRRLKCDQAQTFRNFNNIVSVSIVSEIKRKQHFDQHLEARIVCDASTSGLGASLEKILQRDV